MKFFIFSPAPKCNTLEFKCIYLAICCAQLNMNKFTKDEDEH